MTTNRIKKEIREELTTRGILPTKAIVDQCYHYHMVTDLGCPEVDIEDAVDVYQAEHTEATND